MAKIPRVTFKQFGVNANTASDICEFGTPATGSPVYTGNIATLQAAAAWLTGWAAETIASNRPFLEDMNAVCAVFAYMIAYQFQMGIPEFDTGTTYYTNSIVQYNGVLYTSLTDSNIGNTPAIGTYWTSTVPSISGILGAWTTSASVFGVGGSIAHDVIYKAATDGFVVIQIANTAGNNQQSWQFYTDSTSSPSTMVGQTYSSSSTTNLSFPAIFPVKKGDYWTITTYDSASVSGIRWIPLGS